MKAISLTILLLSISLPGFAKPDCPKSIWAHGEVSISKDIKGYAYSDVLDVMGHLDEAYEPLLLVGDKIEISAMMNFHKAKRVKKKDRCIYRTEGISVLGPNYSVPMMGRNQDSNLSGWLEYDDNGELARAKVTRINIARTAQRKAFNGKVYPMVFTKFGLSLFGDVVTKDGENQWSLSSKLMEIDFSSGHMQYGSGQLELIEADFGKRREAEAGQ